MNQNRSIQYLQQNCDIAVPYFVERMQQAGLTVMRTFDLRETRIEETACNCPNHGTEKCDCELVVLLVYGKDTQPASIVAHGHHGQTWFSLVDSFGAVNSRLVTQIYDIFAPSGID